MPMPVRVCGGSAIPEGRDGGALSGIHGDAEGSTWLRFLRRRERQSGVVLKTLFSELKELSGDRGGKKVLKRHWESVIPFRVEAAWELKDLDRKEDL